MVERRLKEKLERFVYELLLERDTPVSVKEIKEALKKYPEITEPRIRQAIMQLELNGYVVTYERKENDMIVVLNGDSNGSGSDRARTTRAA
jgi:Fe2+ or Zn2+ uptake regulation protein